MCYGETAVESHHFIGVGPFSQSFQAAAADLAALSKRVTGLIRDSGLEVMADLVTPFPDGGATLVWVLAESHVVMHYWSGEGFVTIDIHVCDYTSSNSEKAARLKHLLQRLCFVRSECQWKEIVLDQPALALAGDPATP